MDTATEVAPTTSPRCSPVTAEGRGARRSAWPSTWLVALTASVVSFATLVLALLLAGGRPVPAPLGLPDAGLLTGWGLRLARLTMEATGVLTVGSLVVGAVLVPGGGGPLHPGARRALRSAGWWAVAWAVSAVGCFVLTVSDTAGMRLTELTVGVVRVLSSTAQGRALLLVTFLACVVAVAARRAGTVRAARLVLLLALAALLPVPVTGHAATAAEHDVVVSALAVHVVAASVWVGGLAGLVAHLRRDPQLLARSAARFSGVALAAYLALGGSGLLAASTRLGTSLATWTSGYGALVLAKGGLLLVLGTVGVLHRRRTLPQLAGRRPHAFLRLAGGELVLMGAGFGMAAALARTPVPAAPVVADPVHGSGHSSLPTVVDPFSVEQLLTAWRVNAVVVLALGVALAMYIAGARALAGAGLPWSRRRTACFAAGIGLALVTSCSGLATYAPAMVSVQIAQLLLALLPVPLLLALGAPLTLWLQVRELRPAPETRRHLLDLPAVRLLSDPFTGAAIACALLLGLYRTSLIEASLRSTWLHLAVLLLATGAGLLLLWPVLGVDPVARARGSAERAGAVLGVAACLGILALQLGYGDRLLAGAWFLELRWGWVDPVEDQHVGAAVAGVAAVALATFTALRHLGARRS